jgi:hypothetical protein
MSVVERALLRRGCAGHHNERQQRERDLGDWLHHHCMYCAVNASNASRDAQIQNA